MGGGAVQWGVTLGVSLCDTPMGGCLYMCPCVSSPHMPPLHKRVQAHGEWGRTAGGGGGTGPPPKQHFGGQWGGACSASHGGGGGGWGCACGSQRLWAVASGPSLMRGPGPLCKLPFPPPQAQTQEPSEGGWGEGSHTMVALAQGQFMRGSRMRVALAEGQLSHNALAREHPSPEPWGCAGWSSIKGGSPGRGGGCPGGPGFRGGVHGTSPKGHFQPSTKWGGWPPSKPPRGGQAEVGGGLWQAPWEDWGCPQKWGLGGSPMGEDWGGSPEFGGGLPGGPQSWEGGAQVGLQGAGWEGVPMGGGSHGSGEQIGEDPMPGGHSELRMGGLGGRQGGG